MRRAARSGRPSLTERPPLPATRCDAPDAPGRAYAPSRRPALTSTSTGKRPGTNARRSSRPAICTRATAEARARPNTVPVRRSLRVQESASPADARARMHAPLLRVWMRSSPPRPLRTPSTDDTQSSAAAPKSRLLSREASVLARPMPCHFGPSPAAVPRPFRVRRTAALQQQASGNAPHSRGALKSQPFPADKSWKAATKAVFVVPQLHSRGFTQRTEIVFTPLRHGAETSPDGQHLLPARAP